MFTVKQNLKLELLESHCLFYVTPGLIFMNSAIYQQSMFLLHVTEQLLFL